MIVLPFTNPRSGNVWQLLAIPFERVDALLIGNTNDTYPQAVGYTEKLTFRFIPGTYRALTSAELTSDDLKTALVVEGRLSVADILP